ncbi:putative NUDIX hydrolase [Burkholderiales bacterium]|nr:putative NUDIX hydrolase [Burkholderiales bacterium]
MTPVAVGVLFRADGAVLLADRPAGKPYAGYWEFPGGKIEPGESVEQALARELAEELGVRVRAADPWTVLEYDYPHAYVRLHFRRIFDWVGTPRPVEGQRLMFLPAGGLPPAPLLPAAIPALRWIQLPTVTGYSERTSVDAGQAQHWMERALARGLRQILWYEPKLAGTALETALRGCSARASAYGARLLVDSRMAPVAPDLGAGCFLSASVLRSTRVRPPHRWAGAGVRDSDDLRHAASLGCDFAVIEGTGCGEDGAPEEQLASWETISELCRETPLPLYAALAPSVDNLRQARRHGAHGLALRPPF